MSFISMGLFLFAAAVDGIADAEDRSDEEDFEFEGVGGEVDAERLVLGHELGGGHAEDAGTEIDEGGDFEHDHQEDLGAEQDDGDGDHEAADDQAPLALWHGVGDAGEREDVVDAHDEVGN